MARPRVHLRNAPIVEAIIDFRVLREPSVSVEVFAGLQRSIGEKYAQVDSILSFEARFGIDRGKVLDPAAKRADLGWKYQAGKEVAQFRVDGFTFSKIEPYTTWEEVFGEAFRLWRIYAELAKPKQLSRVAVRYINRMKISGSRNISDFLSAAPLLPPPISPLILDFLTRVHIADEGRRSAAAVVQALEPQLDPNVMSLLLDIDAYHEGMLAPGDPKIPEYFQRLRELKNEIFYASITEKTAEMYE
jgi:uncharacterized protein (TIGR04255 family)